MLQLKDIVKEYPVGDGIVTALKGVSLDFRDSEFVAVLGPSGCGKTTLLNIAGGLDSYTSGDLIINGTSTKDYKDTNWDAYRNHSVGFVFQSYNLIPHQTVLSNVELALKISGVSKAERRKRATAALEKVGLGDQINKKPNTLSGGQMQRVAIARALINDPAIIFADEPTGALDSEISVQVMDLLKEISSDRLVIMVTHNPELARDYATRTIRLRDGQVVSDSNPMSAEDLIVEHASPKPERTKLSFKTALGLSLNNLMTKKGRTILTSFAGAIGIIGIALILALSNGMNNYVATIESETMGSYPIELEKEAIDIDSMMGTASGGGAFFGSETEDAETEGTAQGIYSSNIVASSVASSTSLTKTNDLGKFKTYLEANTDDANGSLAAVEYGYDIEPLAYRLITAEEDDSADEVFLVSPTSLDTTGSGQTTNGESTSSTNGDSNAAAGNAMMSSMGSFSAGSSFSGSASSAWKQLVNNQTLKESHYELLEGTWPTEANEVALVVSSNNKVSDYDLYMLGLMDIDEMNDLVNAVKNDEDYDDKEQNFSYGDVIGLNYEVFAPSELYSKSESDGVWIDKSSDQDYLNEIYGDGLTVTITCVLRAGDGAEITSGVAYTGALTEYLMTLTSSSDIVNDQLADPNTNVFTGEAFEDTADASTDESATSDGEATEAEATEDEQAAAAAAAASGYDMSAYSGYDTSGMNGTGEATMSLTADQLAILMAQMSSTTPSTYDEVLEALGYVTEDQPSSIALYPTNFEAKDTIEGLISDYNNQVTDDTDRVTYTDMVGLLTSSITTIVDTISLILIAFVAISLVVSCIMIAIITYISVLERTKEIGVLRALGAAKSDVSKIFNAETFIEGLVSGVSAIVVTLLLCIPINAVVSSMLGVDNIASLPLEYSLVLIAISVVLTLIAGFIPARMAAKKDPVVALRTE